MSIRGYKAFLTGTRLDLELAIGLMVQAGPSRLESAGPLSESDAIMQLRPIIASVIAEIREREAEYAKTKVPRFQRGPA